MVNIGLLGSMGRLKKYDGISVHFGRKGLEFWHLRKREGGGIGKMYCGLLALGFVLL